MKRFLKYSKGEIDRAGDVLAGKSVKGMSRDLAIKILENFRSIHTHPLNVFRMELLKKTNEVGEGSLISQRLKRAPSIVRKLKIQKNMSLSQMQDIGGIRAVVKDNGDVYKLRDLIKKSEDQPAFKSILTKEADYIKEPKDSGYRSIHLIYKYGEKVKVENACRIEVQLRTKIQHAWATAVEVMGTYLRQPLKQSFGNKEWLDLFKEISKVFEYLENGNVDFDLYKKTLINIDAMKLKDLLEGFSAATRFSEKDIIKRRGKYFLITLDFKNKKVDIERFSDSMLDQANSRYSEKEKAYLNEDAYQIVLVSVSDLKNLKQLYPNYFLDTQEFIKYLKDVEEKTRKLEK